MKMKFKILKILYSKKGYNKFKLIIRLKKIRVMINKKFNSLKIKILMIAIKILINKK